MFWIIGHPNLHLVVLPFTTDAPVIPIKGIFSQRAFPKCERNSPAESDQLHELICEAFIVVFNVILFSLVHF